MHVEPRKLSEYPWYLKPFFWNQKRKYGEVLVPGLVWGRVPGLFMAVAVLFGVYERRRSPLLPALRSMITVRVSQINHCAFCIDANSAMLHKRGVDWNKIEALSEWSHSPLFDETERLVLTYVEAMTYTEGKVTADMVAGLRQLFGEDGLVELTGLIAFQNMSSKFNSALDIPPQGLCLLQRSPKADNPR
jgi:AhpD family alkylhydroperoxidase